MLSENKQARCGYVLLIILYLRKSRNYVLKTHWLLLPSLKKKKKNLDIVLYWLTILAKGMLASLPERVEMA